MCQVWCRDRAYQHPAVEADAEGQVESRDGQQSSEPLQQQGHQAHLEHVGVEHHQQDDDHVEQGGDVLDAAGMQTTHGTESRGQESMGRRGNNAFQLLN